MSETNTGKRADLVRSSLIFQLKLLADGARDFMLVPVALIATLVGLIRSGDDPEVEFEQILELGRRTERWIDLFGTHGKADQPPDPNSLESLVARAEEVVRDQAKRGDVSESASAAIERALSGLHAKSKETNPTQQKDAGKASQ